MVTKHTFKSFKDYAKCIGPQDWKKFSPELTKRAHGVKVYIVDGDFIRSNINVDYVEGGHGYVYDYIPTDEIWVEDMEDKQEEFFNFTHEDYERAKMKANPNMSYDTAHDKACEKETKLRHKLDTEYTGEFKTNVHSNI